MKKSPTLRRNPVAVQANRKKPVVMKHRLSPKGGAKNNQAIMLEEICIFCEAVPCECDDSD